MNARYLPSGDTPAVSRPGPKTELSTSASQSRRSRFESRAMNLVSPAAASYTYRLHAPAPSELMQFPGVPPAASTPLATKYAYLPSSLAPITVPRTSPDSPALRGIDRSFRRHVSLPPTSTISHI